MKRAALVAAVFVWSWALVVSADSRHEAKPPVIHYEVLVQVVEPPPIEPKPTPIADALVDWDEHYRETDCLWVILREQFGYDITMERVTAAALWTHELGGACHLIGEDDE